MVNYAKKTLCLIVAKPLPRVYMQDKTPTRTPPFPTTKTYPKPPTPKFPESNSNNNQFSQCQQNQRPSQPPPRIPSLMKPMKLSTKPIPPPKPAKTKQQVSDALKRETNLELPVRVVYETFI